MGLGAEKIGVDGLGGIDVGTGYTMACKVKSPERDNKRGRHIPGAVYVNMM
jgi:hypothetical protein